MNPIERWNILFFQHEEKAIIPFLRTLNVAQKNTLLPHLSRTAKDFLEIKDRLINNKHFYAKKASIKQERILTITIFITTYKTNHPLHKWLNANYLITYFTLENILPWYCPNWLNDYINSFEQQKKLPKSMTYELIVSMLQKGYIEPSKRLIARLFSKLIFLNSPKERLLFLYQPEKLIQFPITLNQHLWWVFEYGSEISTIERHLRIEDRASLPKSLWYTALHQYEQLGYINRLQLLKASIEATQNDLFNKTAISWFIGLSEFLQPTKNEILLLQNSLFITYESPFAKVLNSILKQLLKISSAPNFNVKEGLKDYEKLLVHPTKSVVLNALELLHQLANHHSQSRKKILFLTVQGLIHRDEAIQLKVAKILQIFGQDLADNLTKWVLPFGPNLFQKTIQSFHQLNIKISYQLPNSQTYTNKKIKILDKENSIPIIQTFEDFKNLALIVFDNHQPYHFDQFLAKLLQFQFEIKGKNINALLPIFRRAYQLVFNELPSHQGMLDNILAIFLMDLVDLLISQYPEDSKNLRKLAESYLEQGFFIKEKDSPFELQYAHLYGWYNPYDPSMVYMPIQKILAKVLSFLHEERNISLLSTPTHAPTWIAPTIFVKRFIEYQKKELIPDSMDLQLAISRVCFENRKAALQLANASLEGDYLALVQFLFSAEAPFPANLINEIPVENDSNVKQKKSPIVPFYYSYITAAITKNNSGRFKKKIKIPILKIRPAYFDGSHTWMVFWEERQLEEWSYKTQKLEFTGEPFIHRELQVKLKKGLNIKYHSDFLYQYFPGNNEAFRPNVNDVQRLLGMLPNNPGPLMALLVADNLKYPTFWEVAAKKRVEEMLEWLSKIPNRKYGQGTHLFLAACMLSANQKIRFRVANIWKKSVLNQRINSVLMGQYLGKMESREFAPLKRFSDTIQKELFNLSTLHNQALEAMVGNLLARLPAIPIKNTRTLLVLYRELLALNSSKITHPRLMILLDLWTKSASLKKVIRELRSFC